MVRAGAGYGGRRLNHIEAVHLSADAIGFGKLVQLAPPIKIFHVADVTGAARQEIRVERQNDCRVFQPVRSVDVTTEGQLRSLARAIAARGLPLMPLSLGIKL